MVLVFRKTDKIVNILDISTVFKLQNTVSMAFHLHTNLHKRLFLYPHLKSQRNDINNSLNEFDFGRWPNFQQWTDKMEENG